MVMIGLSIVAAPGQESGQASAVPPFQKLSGVIRWSKEMGVPPTEYLCEAFHVVVLDPEKDNKPYWFANVLTPGRDDPQFYSCKYEITVPTGKRLLVKAGLGKAFSSPGYDLEQAQWERPGQPKSDNNKSGAGQFLPLGTYLARVFEPAEKYVILGVKGTNLNFKMIFGIKARKGGFPF